MWNWKKIKQVAEENGLTYHLLKTWVDKGLVKTTKTLGNRHYFSPEQEKEFIKQLKGDAE